MAKAHFTLQGKGGVGKSLVSALIAQHRQGNGISLVCIDTDPVNATFTGYSAFPVERVELLKDNTIDEREFDRLIEIITENRNSEIVIDNGSSSFIPLSSYLIENEAIEMLHEMGHEIFIHPVITGGQSLMDTLSGFDSLARQFPESAKIIVWLNQYFGNIEKEDKTFEKMKVYQDHKDRVAGIINIPRNSGATFGEDMQQMLESRMTFEQAIKSDQFKLMSKHRLKMMKKILFDQMNPVLGVTASTTNKSDSGNEPPPRRIRKRSKAASE
ncbi:nucleotide-binding protein [Candidatus Nitrosacidococcus tergens]|uniref:Protein TraL n=1 Tax=Candidatus Nitrosacidococcus tergens TaxID=553981 RepID=A0A7G1Q934_9GAMM|nr:conjugal transfer protein TraL [Candidatus Nitrosacidococcus tergens]CAB1275625.1 Protein TraL [Candidatus Nitrosacidococcus tergens]